MGNNIYCPNQVVIDGNVTVIQKKPFVAVITPQFTHLMLPKKHQWMLTGSYPTSVIDVEAYPFDRLSKAISERLYNAIDQAEFNNIIESGSKTEKVWLKLNHSKHSKLSKRKADVLALFEQAASAGK